MLEDCKFEVWNYKYNQFTPVKIKEKVDSRFVKIHGYAKVRDEKTGEMKIEEYDTMTYLKSLKGIGSWELDILKLFPENSMLKVNGFEVIVEKADFNKAGNIRLFYKYIQCDENKGQEIRDAFPAWSWINSYNAQFEKINHAYNFIVLKPEDKVIFGPFLPSRLEEHRKEWYFEDPVYRPVIVYLENLLGYTRPDGKTWMEYFWEGTDKKKLGIKIKDDGTLVCFDVRDPKKPVQVCSESNIEVFIEKICEYAKDKMEESENMA